MEPVQPPTPHGTTFLRVSALLAFALLIAVLSSLGIYWYISNQMVQQTQQQVYKPSQTVGTTVSNPSISPTVDETAKIEKLVKDFYKKWITNPPVGIEKNSNILANEGYLTANAVNSIKTAQGYDLATCSQNPLNPEDYNYSSPSMSGDKATMTVSGYYSGSKSTLVITINLLKSGINWMIDDFHCPSPMKQ